MSRKLAFILIAFVVLSGLLALHQCQQAGTAKTQAKVSTGQAGAAYESGGDAADTIGNRMEADAAADQITQENENAIRNAPGATAPVAAGVRDAGLASLCRRNVYRNDPRCLQHAAPR